jgi:hypothetical protein
LVPSFAAPSASASTPALGFASFLLTRTVLHVRASALAPWLPSVVLVLVFIVVLVALWGASHGFLAAFRGVREEKAEAEQVVRSGFEGVRVLILIRATFDCGLRLYGVCCPCGDDLHCFGLGVVGQASKDKRYLGAFRATREFEGVHPFPTKFEQRDIAQVIKRLADVLLIELELLHRAAMCARRRVCHKRYCDWVRFRAEFGVVPCGEYADHDHGWLYAVG